LAELERRMAALQGASTAQQQALRDEVQANSRQLVAQEAYQKGDALWTGTGFSDPRAAIAAFTEAIRLDSNYAAAYARRGRAYTDLEDYQKALADINHALRLDPNLVFGYVGRARTYLAMGEFQRTRDDADEALRLNPGLAIAYFLRGIAKLRLSRGADGSQDISKACDLGFARACTVLTRGRR
jgi:tetratricopeptide (TPR) repeat protein